MSSYLSIGTIPDIGITIRFEANIFKRLQNYFAGWTWRQWASLLLLLVGLVCAIILFKLYYDASLDKETYRWGKIFLIVLGLLSAAASFIVSFLEPDTPGGTKISPLRGAAMMLLIMLAAFGVMVDALTLFEPRAADKEDIRKIRKDIAGTSEKLDSLTVLLKERFPTDPAILDQISGRWGELDPECGLVWQIDIVKEGEKAALIAELVVRPEGVEPYRLLAEITGAYDNVMHVVGEEPRAAMGAAATFRYNPATQRLVWDDRMRDAESEEYRRCPEA